METGRRRYRAIVQTLKGMNLRRLLDVGCGDGNLESQLSAEGLHYKLILGCDINRAKLLELLRLRRTDLATDLVYADAENLPLRPKSFDVVVATEVLEHVPCESKCLKEVHRLCARKVIITVPALRYPSFLLAVGSERLDAWLKAEGHLMPVLTKWIKRLLRWLEGPILPFFLILGIVKTRRLPFYDYRLYHGNVPHRLYTTPYLVRILQEHGFRVETVRGIGFATPYVAELEILLRRASLDRLADVFAKVQAELDEHFVREPDRSENLMVVCARSDQPS